MSDLSECVAYRRVKDAEFSRKHDEGYREFKIGVHFDRQEKMSA